MAVVAGGPGGPFDEVPIDLRTSYDTETSTEKAYGLRDPHRDYVRKDTPDKERPVNPAYIEIGGEEAAKIIASGLRIYAARKVYYRGNNTYRFEFHYLEKLPKEKDIVLYRKTALTKAMVSRYINLKNKINLYQKAVDEIEESLKKEAEQFNLNTKIYTDCGDLRIGDKVTVTLTNKEKLKNLLGPDGFDVYESDPTELHKLILDMDSGLYSVFESVEDCNKALNDTSPTRKTKNAIKIYELYHDAKPGFSIDWFIVKLKLCFTITHSKELSIQTLDS